MQLVEIEKIQERFRKDSGKIQERVLGFVNNDYNSDYSVLLSQIGQVTMQVKCMRYFCIEMYNGSNSLNPCCMNDIFIKNVSMYSSRRPHGLPVLRVNQTTFGIKSIMYEGTKIWNHPLKSINSGENLHIFKQLMKT